MAGWMDGWMDGGGGGGLGGVNGVAGLWEALLSCSMREGGIGKRLDEIGVLGSFLQEYSISVWYVLRRFLPFPSF